MLSVFQAEYQANNISNGVIMQQKHTFREDVHKIRLVFINFLYFPIFKGGYRADRFYQASGTLKKIPYIYNVLQHFVIVSGC